MRDSQQLIFHRFHGFFEYVEFHLLINSIKSEDVNCSPLSDITCPEYKVQKTSFLVVVICAVNKRCVIIY